jgi:uncharacterized membrane protein YbhN (UPF0104 family)
LVVAAIFALLAWQLLLDWRNLPRGFLSDVRYPMLLTSLAVLLPALLLVSLRWGLTLRSMNVPIQWWTSVRIWFLSQAGRYVPGGVWSYVSRFFLGRSEIAQETVVASMIVETALRVASEVLVFLVSLPFWTDLEFLNMQIVPVLVGATGLGLLLLHPSFLERLSRTAPPRWVGLRPLDLSGLRYGTVLLLLAYYMLTVVVVGIAFYLLVAALYPMPVGVLPALTGSLAASMVLGFLVPLAPNGWAVREGVLAFLLGQLMPASVAIVVSIVARIWLSLGEAVWILVSFRLKGAALKAAPGITQKDY